MKQLAKAQLKNEEHLTHLKIKQRNARKLHANFNARLGQDINDEKSEQKVMAIEYKPSADSSFEHVSNSSNRSKKIQLALIPTQTVSQYFLSIKMFRI